MKNLLILLICCISIHNYAQNQVLSLHKKETKRTVLLAENRRIRLKTFQKKIYKGKFHIVDDAHIVIKKDTIALSDISKIRPQSLVSGTFSTLFKGYGGLLILDSIQYFQNGGALGAFVGVIIISIGVTTSLVGFIIDGSNHKAPLWEYAIITKPEKNKPTKVSLENP